MKTPQKEVFRETPAAKKKAPRATWAGIRKGPLEDVAFSEALTMCRVARWVARFREETNIGRISGMIGEAAEKKDWNALAAIIETLGRAEIRERNPYSGQPCGKRVPIYAQCCSAIIGIVKGGENPLSKRMVDELGAIAGESGNPKLKMGIFGIFAALRERRATGMLLDVVQECYSPDKTRNRIVSGLILNSPEVPILCLDSKGEISSIIRDYASSKKDVGCAALAALREICDARTAASLVRMQAGPLEKDLYLEIAILKIEMEDRM